MDLDSRQLRYVVRVAEELNFTRAAEALHVAQQTLSESVRQLERQLGVQLFERSPQRVEVTAAGSVFVAHAIDLLALVEAALVATQAEARRTAGSIAVGTPDWPSGIHLFRRAIDAARQDPAAPVVVTDPTPWIHHIQSVLERRIDIGVTFIVGADDLHDSLTVTPLLEDDAGWVFVSQDHPLIANEVVTVADLASYPILMIERRDHPSLHDRLESHLRSRGVEPLIPDNNPGSFATALAHSMASTGVVMVSRSMAANPPAYMSALRVVDLDIELQLVAISRTGDDRTRPMLDALTLVARGRDGAPHDAPGGG